MREVRLLTNHCSRIGLPLLVALGIMLTGSASTQAANATASVGAQNHESATLDTIRKRAAENWNIIPGLKGAKDVHVRVHLRLNRSGEIVGEPKVTVTSGPEETKIAIASSAVRAVLRAAPFKTLPIDQYDDWKEVIINFDASDPAN